MVDLLELDERLRKVEYGVSELTSTVRYQNQSIGQLLEFTEALKELIIRKVDDEQGSEDISERGLCGRANPVPVSDD